MNKEILEIAYLSDSHFNAVSESIIPMPSCINVDKGITLSHIYFNLKKFDTEADIIVTFSVPVKTELITDEKGNIGPNGFEPAKVLKVKKRNRRIVQ